ncbi:MAG: helix-turn-helix domain-containing protein [Candidatus Doudnabacteria bacterium]|nr:helix-turn-helix domain-containing protein [Candidatus Doudnabacteria bacterium]
MWTGEVTSAEGTIMVTVTRAAELLGLTKDTVRRLCDTKQIPCEVHKGCRLIPKQYVLEKIARAKSATP